MNSAWLVGWNINRFLHCYVMLIHVKNIKEVKYSESQIYEDIARVFYNVVFSTYLGSNAAEKRV